LFEYSSIDQYHSSLQKSETTCSEAVRYYLEKINAFKHLNAFVDVYADAALEQANRLDEKRRSGKSTGKLHGVIVAIKDVICYKGHPVTAASGILKSRLNHALTQGSAGDNREEKKFISIFSSTVVDRLLKEEAIIIGSCNCDEFAMGSTNENSVYGKVLNALDETRVPGGSSGGSAVAVQAGLCMLSLGSDTGGSVRQPADFCGIAGLKPTYGRISRHGLIAYASSFDQIGIFGNNIEDINKVLNAIAGPDEYDSTASQKPVGDYATLEKAGKYRFAYFKETLDHPSLDPEICIAIKKLCDGLKKAGHVVEPLNFEYLDYIVPAYYVLTTAEASSNLSRYDGVRYGYRSPRSAGDLTEFYKRNRSEGFGKEVKRRIMLGVFVLSAGYYDAYFTKAQKVRKLLVDKTELVFKDFDFILMPVSPSVAFKLGEKTEDPIAMYLADIYTVFANLTGIPAIAVPLFKHSSGMPFGVQVMARRFDELSLLRVSQHLVQCFKI